MFPVGPVAETAIFATYKRQQTMLERQRRLNFFAVTLLLTLTLTLQSTNLFSSSVKDHTHHNFSRSY